MFKTSSSRKAVACVFAAVLGLTSSAAMASAMSGPADGDDDNSAPGKAEACAAVGCPNGTRQCGTASGTIISGVPPFVGEVKVSWTCYENANY